MSTQVENDELSLPDTFENAIEFWTPERIQNAVPFDELLESTHESYSAASQPTYRSTAASSAEHIDEQSRIESDFPGGGEVQAPRRPNAHRVVQEQPPVQQQKKKVEDLSMPPYQSIGKIYAAVRKGKEGSLEIKDHTMYVTAFYIGQPTVIKEGKQVVKLLTVAHAFDEKEFKKIKFKIFIPADKSGKYECEEIRRVTLPNCCRKKDKHTIESKNDICVVSISTPIDSQLVPLQLVVKRMVTIRKVMVGPLLAIPHKQLQNSRSQCMR